jgi:hypothetical protein
MEVLLFIKMQAKFLQDISNNNNKVITGIFFLNQNRNNIVDFLKLFSDDN